MIDNIYIEKTDDGFLVTIHSYSRNTRSKRHFKTYDEAVSHVHQELEIQNEQAL